MSAALHGRPCDRDSSGLRLNVLPTSVHFAFLSPSDKLFAVTTIPKVKTIDVYVEISDAAVVKAIDVQHFQEVHLQRCNAVTVISGYAFNSYFSVSQWNQKIFPSMRVPLQRYIRYILLYGDPSPYAADNSLDPFRRGRHAGIRF